MHHSGSLLYIGKDSAHRWAMLRNMVTSLIKHERIMTTTAKAKELRKVADQMVTHAKIGNDDYDEGNNEDDDADDEGGVDDADDHDDDDHDDNANNNNDDDDDDNNEDDDYIDDDDEDYDDGSRILVVVGTIVITNEGYTDEDALGLSLGDDNGITVGTVGFDDGVDSDA